MKSKFNDDLSKRKDLLGVPFEDLGGNDEDARIDYMGKRFMEELMKPGTKGRVAMLIDDERAKIDRHIKKFQERFPRLLFISETKGPSAMVATLMFGLKASE